MKQAKGPTLLPGISTLISATNELLRAAAMNDGPVFLTGEPGTEKAFAAKLIHQLSPRSRRPMSKMSVSWKLPPDLSQHFEQCTGGTLIFHLQKEFPVDMQYTMVEMASHGSFADPLSGDTVVADVRLILMTSLDLEELGGRDQLLPELHELLVAQHIEIPPLRNRPEDIPALARYAIGRARETGKSLAASADASVLALFRQYDWPGNAEELLLVTAQAALATKENQIALDDLPESFLSKLAPEVVESARAVAAAQLEQRAARPATTRRMERREDDRVPTPADDKLSQMETMEELPDSRETLSEETLPQSESPGTDEQAAASRLSPRVLALVRRLNAQAGMLSRQIDGPLETSQQQALIDRIMEKASDEEAIEALERELDRGLDLVLALRRQMALLNVRQQQSEETIRDLVQRLTFASDQDGNDFENGEVTREAQELAASLKAIGRIINRVSTELPQVGSHIESALMGAITDTASASGAFKMLKMKDVNP